MSNDRVVLPWGAWIEERRIELPLPAGWSVDTAEIDGGATGPSLVQALEAPVDAPSVEALAGRGKTAAIAVEDITRPAAAGEVLDALLDRLAEGGIPADRVKVIVALGGHGPMHRHELQLKLGERVMRECDVWNHHPYENLVDLGTSKGGLPIHINRNFAEADVRLAVGSVVPHPYAGFGGGGKIVLPGLAGIETLEMNHRPAVTGLSGAGLGVVEGNRARAEMEEIALAAGLQAVVNIVPGADRKARGFFYGHPVAAHRKAVELARRVFRTPVRPGAEAVLLNAYPKDAELLQVGNAFNAYRTCPEPPARQGGTVIVAAACPFGRGYHSVHGPGGRIYREPVPRPYLEGRRLIVYAPLLSRHDVLKSFWEGYEHARDWPSVCRRLEESHPGGGRMLVFPTAPLALPFVEEEKS
ncbi:MAG: lactate racemase domain-containing protein [Acidobacteriota bacterium]|nr:lactate racemase domain-containing protein [Acidobacteriota bacterium]MDQ7088880.1 lactate racemase domain-containing protein [Acidobacteriota bacterium]